MEINEQDSKLQMNNLPGPKVSSRFSAPDADLVLQSSDNVQFKVHRLNLKMHSDIFADAEDISAPPPPPLSKSTLDSSSPSLATIARPKPHVEVVVLSETAPVLELLLQYMYRQPPPDLSKIGFEFLAGLAEAAEKYRVYYAIDGCRRAMQEAISADGNAFKVLRWAVKHKHTDIIDKAAQSAISLPITRVRMVLEPNLYLAWADYQRLWMETLQREMTRYPPTQAHWNSNTRESDLICEPWTHAYALFMHKLAGKPWHLLQADDLFRQSEDHLATRCPECRETLGNWKKATERDVDRMAKFSSYLY